MDKLAYKLACLEDVLRQYDELGIALACCDENPLLSYIAKEVLGTRAFALNADAEIFAADDEELCEVNLHEQGLELFTITTCEMAEPAFLRNGPRRCYYCRLYVLGALAKAGRRFGVQHIAVGVTTDIVSYKPETFDAITELHLETPFMLANISHADAYDIARRKNIRLTKMGRCLVQRFPIGMPLDSASMAFVGDAEVFLRQCGLSARVQLVTRGKLNIILSEDAYPLEDETRQEIEAFMFARRYKILQWKKSCNYK